ncbi:hypothetical protein DFH06DRAFT_8602 [Mycena polygramma]|nr:hypothetical protein DFH06DRAFT_8602 [Mycena polygramma]
MPPSRSHRTPKCAPSVNTSSLNHITGESSKRDLAYAAAQLDTRSRETQLRWKTWCEDQNNVWTPTTGGDDNHPQNTMVIYGTEAKSYYRLTDSELLTVPHVEMRSEDGRKTVVYDHTDITHLVDRKHAMLAGEEPNESVEFFSKGRHHFLEFNRKRDATRKKSGCKPLGQPRVVTFSKSQEISTRIYAKSTAAQTSEEQTIYETEDDYYREALVDELDRFFAPKTQSSDSVDVLSSWAVYN